MKMISPVVIDELGACLDDGSCTAITDCINLVIETRNIEAFGQELFSP